MASKTEEKQDYLKVLRDLLPENKVVYAVWLRSTASFHLVQLLIIEHNPTYKDKVTLLDITSQVNDYCGYGLVNGSIRFRRDRSIDGRLGELVKSIDADLFGTFGPGPTPYRERKLGYVVM